MLINELIYLIILGVSRQDSRLSVKSLIESIENAAKAAKQSPAASPAADWPQVRLHSFTHSLIHIFIHSLIYSHTLCMSLFYEYGVITHIQDLSNNFLFNFNKIW